jgi:hypothetical protein
MRVKKISPARQIQRAGKTDSAQRARQIQRSFLWIKNIFNLESKTYAQDRFSVDNFSLS